MLWVLPGWLIWSLYDAANFYGIFVDDVFICLGIAILVIYVPSQELKKRVDELAPKLGFVVLTGTICLAVCIKSFNEFEESLWNRHCLYYFFKKKNLDNTLFLRTEYIF